MDKSPKQEIRKLDYLVNSMSFDIPPYQRPYKWTEKNVVQLLEDIYEYVVSKEKNYRIGSIILHENDIVDGQQRLTTISLLLKCLNSSFDKLLLAKEFKHNVSKHNIRYNYNIINDWLKAKLKTDKDKKNFEQRILEKCEFVIFTVYDQDEAFQLFDSQNARGKELEPYDLLKAFHLREMELDKECDENISKCVEQWEKSIDENELKPILNNHLFRIRKWSKNELRYNFTNHDIDEFKGISLHQYPQYSFEMALRILDGFVDNIKNDTFLKILHIKQSFPFSIAMPIINGKRFFEYVNFYINQKNKLFNKNEGAEFYGFYEEYCLYDKATRSGDEKIRNLYENILIFFVDKFGREYLKKDIYEAFYKAAYIFRCNSGGISLKSILKILKDDAIIIFQKINNAISPDILKNYQYKIYKIEKNNPVKGIDKIINFIK